MTIPVSTVVNVSITRQTQFPSRASFGIGNIVGISGTISANQRIRLYADMSGVAGDFLTTDEEYIAAQSYFGQSPRATALYISRMINVNIAAELRTGSNKTTDMTVWPAVSNGSFRITVNGVTANVIALNFTATVDLAGVAAVIQAGLVTAGFAGSTCAYDLKQKRFIIKSGTTGAASTISFLITSTASVGTDISGVAAGLNKYIDGSATSDSDLNQGLNAQDEPTTMDTIQAANNNWYGFSLTKTFRDNTSARAFSLWAESQTKLFFNATNDANVLSSSSTTDIAYQLSALNRFRTILFYHKDATLYPDAAYMARIFVDDPGTSTGKFKVLNGIPPSDNVSFNQLTILKSKHCNIFITVGNVAITQEGVVTGGVQLGEYIDTMRGVDWLQNAIQINVYAVLYKEDKVPYTDTGVAELISAVAQALDEGERVGFIAPRIDAFGVLQPSYIISALPVALVNQTIRAQRISPDIVFNAMLASSIHFVNVKGNVEV